MPAATSGVLVIDKPEGLSSAKAVAKVKRALQVRKAGHAGTLDPFATGVLVCCVNRATRLARFLLAGDKRYEARLRLGLVTDTQDATGQVIAQHPVPDSTPQTMQAIADAFRAMEGTIEQKPPVYSALKHQGTPLYRLARQGRPVQKPARPVEIKCLRIRQIALPDIDFEVTCSAGTYVRTLCADIGDRLGCGGHLAALRRTACSGFTAAEAMALETVVSTADTARQHLVPMSAALRHLHALAVDDATAQAIANGQPLGFERFAQRLPPKCGDRFQIIDERGFLLAVMEQDRQNRQLNYMCVFQGADGPTNDATSGGTSSGIYNEREKRAD